MQPMRATPWLRSAPRAGASNAAIDPPARITLARIRQLIGHPSYGAMITESCIFGTEFCSVCQYFAQHGRFVARSVRLLHESTVTMNLREFLADPDRALWTVPLPS